MKKRINSYVISGPTGNYDQFVPVATNGGEKKSYEKALRLIDGEEGYAIGVEYEDGEVTFEW